MNYFSLLFSIALLIPVNVIFAQTYKLADGNEKTKYDDIVYSKSQEERNIFNKRKENQYALMHESILSSDFLLLRSLLNKEKFNELNSTIIQLDDSFTTNELSEDSYFTTFEAFGIKDQSLSPLFNAWVKSTPNSYQPFIARAIYYYSMGWLSRGNKWASETKEEQIKGLNSYLDKASKDLRMALNINKKSLISYYYLIQISVTQGEYDEAEQLLNKALEIRPSSYSIRAKYLKSLTPRWGGSLEAMQKYIDDASTDIKRYPELKLLEGYIYTELGDMNVLINKYTDADRLFSKSLEFGESHTVYFKRGRNNNRREEYLNSLNDLNKAIELNNIKPIYYYWRAATFIDMKEYSKAVKDIQIAVQLDPYDEDIKNKRKWLVAKFNHEAYKLRQKQKTDLAIEKYSTAMSLNPEDATIFYGRARAYIQKRDLDLALVDLERAIEIDPDDINNYLLIDYVLAKSRDWDQIIGYWDKFIDLHPDNGRAYVERGGAYFYKGDMKSALRNAKISADLGNLEGIEAYRKFSAGVE
ncbi:MAG: DUF4034 domain-containing protein [Candidatus Thiodiazotropha sp. L084R]